MYYIFNIIKKLERRTFMHNKSFEEIQKSSNLWAESGYSYDTTQEAMSNVSNDIPYKTTTSNELITDHITGDDALTQGSEEKSFLNRK